MPSPAARDPQASRSSALLLASKQCYGHQNLDAGMQEPFALALLEVTPTATGAPYTYRKAGPEVSKRNVSYRSKAEELNLSIMGPPILPLPTLERTSRTAEKRHKLPSSSGAEAYARVAKVEADRCCWCPSATKRGTNSGEFRNRDTR